MCANAPRRGLQRGNCNILISRTQRAATYQVIGLVNSREIIDNQADDDNDEAGGEEDTDDNTNNFQTSTTTASTAFEEINKTKQPRRIITYMSPFVGTPYVRTE